MRLFERGATSWHFFAKFKEIVILSLKLVKFESVEFMYGISSDHLRVASTSPFLIIEQITRTTAINEYISSVNNPPPPPYEKRHTLKNDFFDF